jgi:hypothetical protein
VTVEVTPNDGTVDGLTRISDPITVVDALPVLAAATIDPTVVREGSVLTCMLAGFTDRDGDADASVVRWFVNDAVVSSGPASTPLSGTAFSRGDRVRCEGEPQSGDPVASGAVVRSGELVVLNTPPRVATVTVTPAQPTVAATLHADVAGLVDDDGDAVTTTIA